MHLGIGGTTGVKPAQATHSWIDRSTQVSRSSRVLACKSAELAHELIEASLDCSVVLSALYEQFVRCIKVSLKMLVGFFERVVLRTKFVRLVFCLDSTFECVVVLPDNSARERNDHERNCRVDVETDHRERSPTARPTMKLSTPAARAAVMIACLAVV